MMTRLNDLGLPNVETMDALARELGMYASERFVVFVEGLLLKIIERQIGAWRDVLDAVVKTVAKWIRELDEGLQLLAQRLEEIGADIARLIGQIEDRLLEARGALHALLDSFSESEARDEFVDRVADATASRAIGELEDNWIYRKVVPSSLRSDIRSTVRSIIRAGVRNEAVDQVLEAIGVLSDEVDEIVDDARSVDRDRPLGPQLRDRVLGRVVEAVDAHFGTVRIDVRFKVDWRAFGLRIERTIDLGSIRVPLGSVTDAVRPMVNGLSVFDDAIDTMETALEALFADETEVGELEVERAAVVKEQEKTTAHAKEMRPGPKRVIIDRPVSMQTMAGDAAVVIRFTGFTPTILEGDDSTPQRVHAILNGEAVDLGSFQIDRAEDGAAIIGARGALPGGVILARSRLNDGQAGAAAKAVRHSSSSPSGAGSPGRGGKPGIGSAALRGSGLPSLRQNQSEGFSLSGTLPQSLLRPGVNTLLVEVIAGTNVRVHTSVGFIVAPTPPPIRTRDVDKRPFVGRFAGTPPPTAAALGHGTIRHSLARERRAAAAGLARTIAQRPVVRPLVQLATVSPKIAERLNLPVVSRPARPPKLKTIALRDKDDYA
jgi:hypothetical protein